jgi:hypothetical protein
MATDHEREHLDPREVRNPHTRYERRTFNVRLVLLTMAAMVVAGVLIHFFVAGIWTLFDKQARSADQEHKPMLSSVPGPNEPQRLPPLPRLQPDPVSDLHAMREAEDNVLQTYGWVDKNAGVVRIPVARALDLLAQRGLPNWGSPAPGTQAADAKTPAAKSKPAGSGTGK